MRNITFVKHSEAKGNLLIIPVCEGEPLSSFGQELNQTLKGSIQFHFQCESFEGKSDQLLILTTHGHYSIPKILFLGLGPRAHLSKAALQEAGGIIMTAIEQISGSHTAVLDCSSLENEEGYLHLPFGLLLKEWRFEKYKKSKNETPRSLQCLCQNPSLAQEEFKHYLSLYGGIDLAKQLTSEPANFLFPETFASHCLKLQDLGVEVEVLDENALALLGENAILAVGKGSFRHPRLVTMQWRGKDSTSPPIVLIGKGVCFDSGGINIKTTSEIVDMKWDKAGAAVVTGTIYALAHMKLPVNVVGVVGLVENMPDGKALKPGDIITMLSGLTVEVIDTDNEGRLVLADCLWYAQEKFAPQTMLDLGTLTVETIGALASEYAGLFTENEELAKSLIASGKRSGEKVWQLPMGEPFSKHIQSTVADVKNIGILGYGESSAAAEFLKCFVKPSVPWAHLDISGVSWVKEESALSTPGVTGYGVRLLVEWIRRQ